MKNIVLIIPSLTIGGAEKQAYNYALEIKKYSGYNPIIVGLGKQGALVDVLNNSNIQYATFRLNQFEHQSRLSKIITLIRFIIFIKKLKPFITISFTFWPNIISGLTWRFTGSKFNYWNQRSIDENISITFWEKIIIKLKPIYIANSYAGANFISERHKLNKENIRIIHNYIDLNESIKKSQITDDETIKFLMIANFFPEKDHKTVLLAFSKYLNKNPNSKAELHFIGNAPGLSYAMIKTKSLAFELNLMKNVFFHGLITNPSSFEIKFDIGILSTYSEGFSNTIMEYMLSKLPVIATNIPSNLELLGEANKNWLFDIEDSDSLAEKMHLLSNDQKLRNILGEHNFKLVTENFNLTKFSKQIASILYAK